MFGERLQRLGLRLCWEHLLLPDLFAQLLWSRFGPMHTFRHFGSPCQKKWLLMITHFLVLILEPRQRREVLGVIVCLDWHLLTSFHWDCDALSPSESGLRWHVALSRCGMPSGSQLEALMVAGTDWKDALIQQIVIPPFSSTIFNYNWKEVMAWNGKIIEPGLHTPSVATLYD